MRPTVTYTPYDMSSKEQTGDVITFTQFEQGNILTGTRNDKESGDKSDSESIMMSEKDTENLDETEKFDDDLTRTGLRSEDLFWYTHTRTQKLCRSDKIGPFLRNLRYDSTEYLM